MANFNDDNDICKALGKALAGAIGFLLGILAMILLAGLCGCTTTKYVPMETVRTEYLEADTTAIYNRLLRFFESQRQRESRSDSLIDKTKETVVLNEQGDTTKHYIDHYVYMSSKEKNEYERTIGEKDSIIADLQTRLETAKVDSVAVPYPIERKLSKWEKTKMDFGGIAFGAVGALIVALVAVWLIKRKR